MQLLVSVRSAAEAQSAIAGGADIIDAKEPGNGSLGPVSAAVLADILRVIPAAMPFSIALGDFSHPGDVALAIAEVPARVGDAPCYVKLGFAGVSSPERVRVLLEEARNAATRHPALLHPVAVAYADGRLTSSIAPHQLCRVAVTSGIRAVLLDTQLKGSGNLLTRVSLPAVAELVAELRGCGVLAALAGSLAITDLPVVAAARPDILGFRGAACTGGRDGLVSRSRVEQLRRAMDALGSGSLRQRESEEALGETPDDPANLSPHH